MNTSPIYIVVSIAVVAFVAALVFLISTNRKANRLTPLAGLAFAFILAGLIFGENRVTGYGLFGAGIILAEIEIFTRSKPKQHLKVFHQRIATILDLF